MKDGLIIDFSYSVEDWLNVFKQFIAIITDFFASIGIQLFKEGE